MKHWKVPVIGVLVIALVGFLWLQYRAANERPEPQIIPVAPLTLDTIQPLSREAKQKLIKDFETDPLGFQLIGRLLQLSLERERPVIHVVHSRDGDSPYFPLAEAESVRPVLEFVGKYSGVTFQHQAKAATQPPYEQDTLLIRYKIVNGTYKIERGGFGGTTELEEPHIALTLLEPKRTSGEEAYAIGGRGGDEEKTPYRRAVENLKRGLAECLALPQISERLYPFDPELEARKRAIYEWRENKAPR